MRVTNNMVMNKMMSTLYTNLERMSKTQEQLSTGKKISLPSDDPIVASRALKFRSDISELEQYQKNAEDAASWTEVTDSTLGIIGDVLQKARELAVQAGSDTNTASDRLKIKGEVSQLYNELIKLSNSSYAGRFLFSGLKTDQPLVLEKNKTTVYTDVSAIPDGTGDYKLPHQNITFNGGDYIKGKVDGVNTTFTIVPGVPANTGEVQVDSVTGKLSFFANDKTTGTGVTDVIAKYTVVRAAGDYNPDVYSFSDNTQTNPLDDENISFEVGVSDKININTIGSTIFGNAVGTSSQGSNLTKINDFITALTNNDNVGIGQAISNIDSFMDSVLQERSDIGARSNRIELTIQRLADDFTNLSGLSSKNEDADMAEVIMNLKNQENVYRASLEAGARIIQPTLVEFLR